MGRILTDGECDKDVTGGDLNEWNRIVDPEKEIKVSQKRGQRIEQTENDEETETGWRKEESNIYLQNHKRHEMIFIQQDILVIQERPRMLVSW